MSSTAVRVGETSTLVTSVAGGVGATIVPEAVTALALEGGPIGRWLAATTVELAVAHRADREEPHLVRAVAVIHRLVGGC
ncbi:hypothetical protein OHB12_04305 [Nocardia sp. NBC_01730]|uniref:hypothetical protein n=1 Tax=Nocardia sp. NBC_01730 TaxID=2975998 RepID=UPI002E160DED|nr:hypothetical protein OHB12_04305 [Nocardia sp. NBC_01730]